jgi:nucleoside-triphosphatase THEP1
MTRQSQRTRPERKLRTEVVREVEEVDREVEDGADSEVDEVVVVDEVSRLEYGQRQLDDRTQRVLATSRGMGIS